MHRVIVIDEQGVVQKRFWIAKAPDASPNPAEISVGDRIEDALGASFEFITASDLGELERLVSLIASANKVDT